MDALRQEDDGAIQNRLGILDTPHNPRHFSSEPLEELCANKSDLAEMLGIQRTQLYQKKLPLKRGTKVRARIIHLVMASDLAFELFGQSRKKTVAWLSTPNTYFFGDSPLEVIMRDEGDSVISWLLERLGKAPGAPF